MDKQRRTGHKGKLLFWFASFYSESEFSLCPLCFYLSIEVQFKKFFYLRIFTNKKFLEVIILPIIWFLFFFLLSCFGLVFLPTTLASLPPGVMLLNRSTTPRNSATNIEKISQKSAPERQRPNRSIVKTDFRVEFVEIKVTIDSCKKQYSEYRKTSPKFREQCLMCVDIIICGKRLRGDKPYLKSPKPKSPLLLRFHVLYGRRIRICC